MKMAKSNLGLIASRKLTVKKIGLLVVVLITFISGCGSVVGNSERFYRDIPRRPINWHEYLTD